MDFERTGVEKFNNILFLACIVGAVIGWAGAEVIYHIAPSMPVVLQAGIYFAVVMLGILIAAFFSELIASRLKDSWSGGEVGRSILLIVVSVLIFGLFGALFQFLYGLGFTNKHMSQIDDYLFVIDNSGSTDESDPNNLRFSEVENLISKLGVNNHFSIEVFDDSIEGKLPLTAVNDTSRKELSQFNNRMKTTGKGGTELQLVLNDVINNYTPDGRNAAVILLSDGESNSSVDYDALGSAYLKKKLPVFCVAFSYMAPSGVHTMKQLAENTNGYYYEINDLKDLQQTIENMFELTSRRSLLERRRGSDVSNLLATILRILFIAILGILVEVALAFVLDCEDLMKMALVIHIPFSILAGITAEVGMRILPLSNVVRLVMGICMAVCIATYTEYTYSFGNEWDFDEDYSDTPTLEVLKAKSASSVKKKRKNRSGGDNSFL